MLVNVATETTSERMRPAARAGCPRRECTRAGCPSIRFFEAASDRAASLRAKPGAVE